MASKLFRHLKISKRTSIYHFKENVFLLPRYVSVSIASLAVGTIALWSLTEIVHLFYLLSAIFGAALSIITDFVLNESWTFSRRRKIGLITTSLPRRFTKHLSTKVVGLVISLSMLTFCTQVLGINYLISNFIGISTSFVWNYSMSYLWVWARRQPVEVKR